mgnify:CR=1 FL=1
METVNVSLRKEVFDRLKSLAEPLVDDASAVIARLISHWDATHSQHRRPAASAQAGSPSFWVSARGERIPVGTKLRAKYLKHLFEAQVTSRGIQFNGTTYDNPSSAGMAAKNAVGTTGKAASTNGWEFWEILDPVSRKWVSIDTLRAKGAA